MDYINQEFLKSWRMARSRDFEREYFEVLAALKDEHISEMLWLLYGKGALKTIVTPFDSLQDGRSWWAIFAAREVNTISSLVKTKPGKMRIWRFLHDASAWV
jgi:hypothetical protein